MGCPAYLAPAPPHMECLGADMSAQGQGNGMMGINGQGGGPNMGMQPQPLQNNMQPGLQPPGASYGGGNMQMPPQMGQMPMGQFPPRQGGGPMGPPMTDPNSAGGFFGHPNHGGMPRFRQ